MNASASTLAEKLQSLNADQLVEVEHFVELLQFQSENHELTRTAAAASSPSFETIWNNSEDASYDAL